jgi:tryptophan 7-halogenase
MRIAVLGGGTAGFIAAAHFTKAFPRAELLHVFDSRIPTIGVGEGTTPRFPAWFEEITGLGGKWRVGIFASLPADKTDRVSL